MTETDGADRMSGDGVVVDVGIPTHAEPKWLTESIESVLAQTLRSWRLVISENAPVKGEAIARIVEPYLGDGRIKHVVTGANLPSQTNGTRLIQTGTAPYVAVLHDDDRWDPDFLERRVDFLERHPQCGYVFGDSRLIDDEGKQIGVVAAPLEEGVHARRDYVPRYLALEIKPMMPSLLVRRSAYEAVGPYFDARFAGDDWEMWLRLALRFPVGYLSVFDSDYRIHPKQLTYSIRWGEELIVFAQHLEDLVDRMLPDVQLSPRELRRRRSDAFLSAALDAAEEGDRRRALRRVAQALRTYPRSLRNPRPWVVLGVLPFGALGRRALSRARTRVRWKSYLGLTAPEAG
jgi:glycosyltransferase involved in cell wall biosynthesis